MNRSQADIAVTAAVAVLTCAAAAAGAPTPVMIAPGLVLFAAPGYLLGRLLLGSHAGLERLAVVTGLAFSVPILGGLLLYAAGVPLHRFAWLALLAGVTLACDVVLLVRRLRNRASEEKPTVKPRERWTLPAWHAVAFGAAVAIAGGAVGLASVGAARQPYPGFTQLWVLHQDAHSSTATLGVTNHEGRTTRYKLIVFHDGQVATTWKLDLTDGRSWDRVTQFTGFYTLTAKLYRLPDLSSAYRYVVIDANRTQPHVQRTRRH